MSAHIIPENAGPYRIVKSMGGTPLVLNDRSGKRKVRIACQTWVQAEEVCRKLNENDHNGVIYA